jgi:MoxR-like ATPase
VNPDIQALQRAMEQLDYVADEAIATAAYLAREMRKPLLVEGEAGGGKTELAKVMARLAATELIRLQCYEGLDVNTALYEWNYARQMLRAGLPSTTGAAHPKSRHSSSAASTCSSARCFARSRGARVRQFC